MRENEYDNEEFFRQYAGMERSQKGLEGAGEWWQLRRLLPPLEGRRVLDLGCGYGWHCRYAAEQGAAQVLGIDSSRRMLEEAEARGNDPRIEYRLCAIEDYGYPEDAWDCVISNLALHYVTDIDAVFAGVRRTLRPGGIFLFNIEHPTFTAGVEQDWARDEAGRPLHWPVDDYFRPGERRTSFLGCHVRKQHHTLTQILMGLLNCGFELQAVEEARPADDQLDVPGMADELRRPMMLMVRARAGETKKRLNELVLRNERPEDWDTVERLIRDAFWNAQTPGASEPYLAHQIRQHTDFVPELDMVAELDGKIVGSILYTVSTLTAEDGTEKKCLTFGPIAVHPDYQRRGIGRALIERTLEKAREMGYESVVIFGHPSNYVARGFVSCLRVNVCIGDGYFPTALLVKPLVDGAFDGRRWRFTESPVCEIDERDAEEYDKRFPPREKQTLPRQEEFFINSHSSLHP